MAFVKWWWAKRDSGEKFLTLIALNILIALISVPFIYTYSVLLFIISFSVTCLLLFSYYCITEVKDQVAKFKKEKDEEAQKIIRKLRGVAAREYHFGPD